MSNKKIFVKELSLAQKIMQKEVDKQKSTISLIASENLTSPNVRQALASVFTNKYAEGYSSARYYSGCEFADEIENYAIHLAKQIFGAKWANVQPHSGSQANQAVFWALLQDLMNTSSSQYGMGDNFKEKTFRNIENNSGANAEVLGNVNNNNCLKNEPNANVAINDEMNSVMEHSINPSANQSANFKPTILSLSLEAGGHLTHGAKVSSIGQLYNIISYTLNEKGLIDMAVVESLALKHKPNLIIAGASAYSRSWDWKKFREIADKVGAYLVVDMAHIAGLVAVGECDNPISFAHVVTSTTHKTLRGPRGGLILSQYGPDSEGEFSKFKDLGAKIDKALFPGIQGGPLMNNIAAKAVAFEEVLTADFRSYIKIVLSNSKKFAEILMAKGFSVVSGGTDNHLFILDCRSFGMNAVECESFLASCGLWVSKSALIGDSWQHSNGVRLGTAYISNFIDDIQTFAEVFAEALVSKNPLPLKNLVQNILANAQVVDSIF